ncbi:nitrogen regulation protein NR(I) [Amphibiibacter pelophylacis]|uniref:Nitrogen regulation protein NR(I) n=1 Tax=Amphibiibacter pelophylacis TaxID=1799477 RepID=A0ACC6P556_9BURK
MNANLQSSTGPGAEVWVVDDDASIRYVLERALVRAGFRLRTFERADAVSQALAASQPDVLLSDVRMPGSSGLELLADIGLRYPLLPVIIMTAYADLDSAVSALQGGAFEHVAKPFDLPQVVHLVEQAVSRRASAEAQSEAPGAAPEPVAPAGGWPDLLGQSPAMQEVFRAIGRLSKSLATVLITGESGTGKELVARALHRHSPRSKGPFVAINTAAIPAELLESELFGHERGAFTGAQSQRPGRFEQAQGGTLFLDEIGDMPFALQNRLLRVLSDGHYYRVGGQQLLRTDVRVIAATHQPLEDRVQQGLFREDLLHRLNVIRLRLPPLRERALDIPALARHFLRGCAPRLGVEAKQLSDEAAALLQGFGFPGNVRQLENMCQWLTIMAPGNRIEVGDLPPEVLDAAAVAGPGSVAPVMLTAVDAPQPARHPAGIHPSAPPSVLAHPAFAPGLAPTEAWSQQLYRSALAALQDGQTPDGLLWGQCIQQAEAALMSAALQATHGRRIEAARRLGLGRNTLTRKLQELGLSASDSADSPDGG